MKRRFLIIGFVVTLGVIAILLVGETLFLHRDNTSNSTATFLSNTSDASVTQAICQKITTDAETCLPKDVAIVSERLVDQEWLIVRATISTVPRSSDAYDMTYVLQKQSGSLVVIAYSGDGFSANAFPTNTPMKIIDEANKS